MIWHLWSAHKKLKAYIVQRLLSSFKLINLGIKPTFSHKAIHNYGQINSFICEKDESLHLKKLYVCVEW